MIIFDGYATAEEKLAHVKPRVSALMAQGKSVCIAAILFVEDAGSQLYTRLKQEAASRVGIEYKIYSFSLKNNAEPVFTKISELNQNPTITGIIIQKPSKRTWVETQTNQLSAEAATSAFNHWWHSLVEKIEPTKDVDGLHPATLAAIEAGTREETGKVMPATAQAVLDILSEAAEKMSQTTEVFTFLKDKKVVVIGKSDIVGKPLFYALRSKDIKTENIGSTELNNLIEQKKYLFDFDVVISSTGRHHLLNSSMFKPHSIIIDVGEPKPDVDPTNLESVADFLTPVPGGVGPMTIACLLENGVTLVEQQTATE